MDDEPEYPGERDAGFWIRLEFISCPKCKAPLAWYEAGYVPGYRVCCRAPYHHFLAE
jgi:hypothetical protein